MPHTPAWQVAVPLAGGAQTTPHMPQFCVSIDGLRHWLPQGTNPGSQAKPHAPVVHWATPCAGAPQVVLQVPQLLESVCVLMQWPPQFLRPIEHTFVQEPEAQTSSAGQVFPQAPQLLGSDPRSTQLFP